MAHSNQELQSYAEQAKHSHDTTETVAPIAPIVLPIAGAILIFLLAFIAVNMA